jgi:hypothetical protein
VGSQLAPPQFALSKRLTQTPRRSVHQGLRTTHRSLAALAGRPCAVPGLIPGGIFPPQAEAPWVATPRWSALSLSLSLIIIIIIIITSSSATSTSQHRYLNMVLHRNRWRTNLYHNAWNALRVIPV